MYPPQGMPARIFRNSLSRSAVRFHASFFAQHSVINISVKDIICLVELSVLGMLCMSCLSARVVDAGQSATTGWVFYSNAHARNLISLHRTRSLTLNLSPRARLYVPGML